MTTVLEEYITEEQRSVVLFLLAKGLNAKDILKECFLLTAGSVVAQGRERTTLVTNVSLMTKRLKRRCGSG
jgi:hypothetical protein